MRRRDEKAEQSMHQLYTKAAKTISFDKIVLKKLEERAKEQKTSVSNLVNMMCRSKVMTDPEFYSEMSKHHYLEFQRYQYMKKESLDVQEVIR